MKAKILQYLEAIESEKNIKILLACETGSRAWGFPSPDSDYDVRIIYVHKKDWYLSLTEKKDTIERMYENNDIDITGWDLRKSLRLLTKSNGALLERIQSPIIYKQDENFVKEINKLSVTAYSRIATCYHYLSKAKKCYAEISGLENYKLKKFFYALRAALACKWILEKEEKPPIFFSYMMDGLQLETSIRAQINDLIELKATKNEAYLHNGETALFRLIETCISNGNEQGKQLSSSKINLDEFNTFFIKYATD